MLLRFWLSVSAAIFAATAVHSQEPLVPLVKDLIQPVIQEHSANAYEKVLQRLAGTEHFPASFKLKLVQATFHQPWDGMIGLEKLGVDAIRAVQSEWPIANAIDALGTAINIEPISSEDIPHHSQSWQDALQRIRDVLQDSARLRNEALQDLTDEQRAFMLQQAGQLITNFSAQTACQEDRYESLLADLQFFTLAAEHIDWAKMAAATKSLSRLTEESWLKQLTTLAKQQPILDTEYDWISGSLVWAEETEHGWIIIGGPDDNSYRLDRPVAVLIDIGGNDTYRGMVAANDLEIGVSLVVDVGGDDTYTSHTFGMATGRLGVGMLVDCDGNDTWTLADGSGGTGFAGIGVLQKRRGNGQFTGSRWTIGTAMAGMGLVFGGLGDDHYQGDIYSIGVGGPLGVGVVIDLAGDDHYRCGFRYGSGYNQSDAPNAKPGDPNFQYEGWGLGIGLGRRFYPWLTEEQQEFRLAQLAGGLGVLIDFEGDDIYESSNFSLGCGYYFGAGLKLDVAGNDEYRTARYGNAAGAHQAIGLAIDYDGSDHYQSTGPTYHGGCAWDHSVFMCIDGGVQNDRYDLQQTSGLGVADHGSLGVFANLGGDNRYVAGSGLGKGGHDSLGIFFDRSGNDHYDEKLNRTNGQSIIDNQGSSLFVDHP